VGKFFDFDKHFVAWVVFVSSSLLVGLLFSYVFGISYAGGLLIVNTAILLDVQLEVDGIARTRAMIENLITKAMESEEKNDKGSEGGDIN
jgi:uncharacterized membrane protein